MSKLAILKDLCSRFLHRRHGSFLAVSMMIFRTKCHLWKEEKPSQSEAASDALLAEACKLPGAVSRAIRFVPLKAS